MERLVSKALTENLRATKVAEIELDESALWLLDVSRNFYGVNQRLRSFLDELYHPFVNPSITLSLMRASVLGDLWWFTSQNENPQRCIRIILDMYRKAEALCQKDAERMQLFSDFLEFSQAMCEQDLPDIFNELLHILKNFIENNLPLFIRLSTQARRTLIFLGHKCHEKDVVVSMLRLILSENLSYWQQNTNISKWLKALKNVPENIDESLLPNDKFYYHWQRHLKQASSPEDFKIVPAFTEIATLHRDYIREFASLSHRVQYIFFLLGQPTMLDMMDHLLWDLNRQLADMYQELSIDEVHDMVDTVFDTLKHFTETHMSIVLDCVLTIGRAVLKGSNSSLHKHIIDHIIDLGFTPPGEVRISGDWQIEVDKNHVKHLRILLELIAINPVQNKDLLAFTIISMSKHGVFISDTDLFQKDVSAFLGANIKTIFVQCKHLLRMFPVFFNEIGAEGEIRDTSTNLDELSQRKDRLIHFLRKQVHTESNNTHITLIECILRYWITLDPSPLEHIIPADVWESIQEIDERTLHQSRATKQFLADNKLTDSELLSLSWQKAEIIFADMEEDYYNKRLKLLCYCHFLLKDKYNLDPYDIVKFLSRYSFFDGHEQNRLRSSLTRRDYDSSIRQMLTYIGRLNAQILDPKPTSPWENIYYKRHIAAGIPSMYGMYREPKLEAMGMVFRLENVIRRLFERSVGQLNLNYINGKTMRRIVRILEIYDYAMRQEMVTSDAFSTALAMLSSVQNISNLSLEQYLDIFNLLKDSVNELANEYYYRFYDNQLSRAKADEDSRTRNEIFAEEFYRNLLSTSFLVQGLDNFITRILESLTQMRQLFSKENIVQLMSYDPDRLFFHLYTRNSRIENQVLLGSKAFFLKRMHQYEFPIPPGFVITTDLFRNRKIINTHPDISSEFDQLLWDNLHKMERYTGLGFGDPQKPLLFSVRSGAPMSLPGAMDTFLNIGLTDEITLKLSQRPNYGWTAWDCYRRLIQSWGMAYGIPRDEFDNVMINYKKSYEIRQKTQFLPQQMREMVDDYKKVLSNYNISLEQDPYRQLYKSISHVLDSWDTKRARMYRAKLHIAEEWGTAVIIQKMVLGNISLNSGTGVVFTHADWHKEPGIFLNGDFTLCSQGEDVVAGLVHTLPISEAERFHRNGDVSLEKDFPALYHSLLRYARQLIEDHNYPHQEIEFTFEGSSEKQLYILQTRNQVIHKSPEYQVLGTSDLHLESLGSGIGIGKGAVNGIIVINQEDIHRFKDHGEALILVRPDTVPDDMMMLFECQGLLTSRGGVTSHAAVTATRLGLIGVVNCRDLVVNEENSTCKIKNVEFKAGDMITLDANGGTIYLGKHPLQSVQSLV
ncbi:MAG: PEP/pyruvate-binding domain-containing protein [Candidatus Cloacimonetes bacterium]|nr:PEP/pyruvate-binding domain-containing protein [Candidatus Cloacimonadota bacterium]